MKLLGKIIKKVAGGFCLVDWFLLIFMIMLFSYMAFHLFAGTMGSQDANTIDIIVRTSAAGIFGYFISSNFVKNRPSSAVQNTDNLGVSVSSGSTPGEPGNYRQNQIGFITSPTSANMELGKTSGLEESSAQVARCNKIQITVVAMIGMISLIILLAARIFVEISPELTATISQLRDFVSACIGFLISCGKS